jgi:RND superfamily putative drug exporter
MFADDNSSALLNAVLSVDPEDLGARTSVDWMREQLPVTDEGAQIQVGGSTALIKDFDERVSETQPLVLGFVALIAFLMLLISVHSVLLALKGVLMTLLSVAAAYGSLVMVFQWGWADALGFPHLTSIDSTVPPLVLAMTFGLSMDYEIFLLTRIRERFLQTGHTRDAVAYGVSTSARTITSAALIMIAVFCGFAFAGMPLVAEIGVACAVAIAVDATIVRLVLVPALMAMFAKWNWWLPGWLGRVLPSVDFDRPLPDVDLGGVVVIPEDITAALAPSADLRMVIKSAAKLQRLAPDAICVADPFAFSGCGRKEADQVGESIADNVDADAVTVAFDPDGEGRTVSTVGVGQATPRKVGPKYRNGIARAMTSWVDRPVHPVTLWRGRLSVALDALENGHRQTTRPKYRRQVPVETTNVQLPTGDRLLIPTGAETLRLKGFLIMSRNSRRDFADFADMVDVMDPETAAEVLGGMDRYYCCQPVGSSSRRHSMATQLVRQLSDPDPSDLDDDWSEPEQRADWEEVRQRCLSVAVAMLEEAR